MASHIPPYGLDEWRGFHSGGDTYEFMLLLSSHTYDPADRFVADIVASELTGVGYARQAAVNPTRTVSVGSERVNYSVDSMDFGAIAVGETYQWIACYKLVTNDADSIVVGYWDLTPKVTTGVSVQPIPVDTGIIHHHA